METSVEMSLYDRMVLNSNGEIRAYDNLFHECTGKYSIDHFFDHVISESGMRYDEKTGRVVFLYLGHLYYIDYSKKLKKQIADGENNPHYEIFRKKLKALIRKSILNEIDDAYFDDYYTKDISRVTLYQDVLNREYNKTCANISKDTAKLVTCGVVSLASLITPYVVARVVGCNVPVSMASTLVVNYIIAKISYFDGDIGRICDTVAKRRDRIEEKELLEKEIDEVGYVLEDLRAREESHKGRGK